MTDEDRYGESGAANMPPFPRRDSESNPDRPTTASEADPDAPLPPPHSPADQPEEESTPDQPSTDPREPRPRESVTHRVSQEAVRRLERVVAAGLEQIADQLEVAADRIDRVAHRRLDRLSGQGERAASAAHSAAGGLNNAAAYLRTNDLEAIRVDLEHEVRHRPVRTLLISAGVGWLLGKILR